MTGKETFEIWAPTGARWVDWVRPVPFVQIDNPEKENPIMNCMIAEINYVELKTNIAVILDLPDYDSIKEGIALARLGFRPIPLYNGTNEPKGTMALVSNHGIESALIWGAGELKKMSISNEAPPVFLLDSNRVHRFKMNVSVFDNSWDLYDQDIPSAEYFLEKGINKIIVRGDSIQKDLIKILYKFQKKGLTILFTDGYEKPKEVSIKKPPKKYR